MPRLRSLLLLAAFLAHASFAAAVSNAPLQALAAYIENSGKCSAQLVEWNQIYSTRVMAGETSRHFYYRALGNQAWGECDRAFFRPIFGELQKIWIIFSQGKVTEAEFEAKESQLMNLLFTALKSGDQGLSIVRDYENTIAGQLIDLDQPKPYASCTYFSDKPRCVD